ncbi:MAG: replication factor C large subunit, partial [Candidatus Pacearchaeota archaeon]
KYFNEIKGQEQAIERVKQFLINFGKYGSSKALILYGPPGVGKTAIAYAAANESLSELFELNASDLRNREKLKEILKPVTEQKSLLKRGKIILVDEVDGISEADFGGLQQLIKLIEFSFYPIIMTANDIWDRKFNELRRRSEILQLKEVSYVTIKEVLIDILRKEKRFVDGSVLNNIVQNSRGDLRAAINDLQTIAFTVEPLGVSIDERDKELDIFNALRIIFKELPDNSSLKIFDSVNKNLDEIMLWIEENIPVEYFGIELSKAFEFLGKADIFRKRIYKHQYWRFLLYQNIFLSYGVSSAKSSKKIGFTNYKKPTRIIKTWINNQEIEIKKSIAKKFASHTHIGEKRALSEFSIIKNILMNQEVQRELRLTPEEIDYLKKVS